MLTSLLPAVRVVGLAALASLAAFGQVNTASLNGTVQDPAGAVIATAGVSLTNVATNVKRTTKTNDAGTYSFLNLAPGTYTLEVSSPGFRSTEDTNISLVVGDVRVRNITLSVGQVDQKVTVTATSASVETATAGLGTAVLERQIKELPLNGRNFTQLLTLSPGASPVNSTQNANGWTQRPTGDFVFPALNGQNNKSLLFVVDGVINLGALFGGYSVAPVIDDLEELKIQSHTDQAEFGQTLGGTVNQVTKSGTNQFHGALWEFLRNDVLDARNPFVFTKKTPLRQNQFGANVGGPVRLPFYNGRNRTFFFGSYEGFRKHTANEVLYRVPTPANLQGDLSDIPFQLYNPFTTRPDPNKAGQFLRDPFPGNIIPPNLLDPNALLYAKTIYPLPVVTRVPGLNGIDNSAAITPQDQFTVRLDQKLTGNDSAWFRLTKVVQDPKSSAGIAGAVFGQLMHGINYGANYMHTFGASTVVHTMFGRNYLYQDVRTKFTAIDSSEFVPKIFTGGYNCNQASGFGSKNCLIPRANIPDFGGATEQNSHIQVSNNWTFGGDLSHVHGRHILKAGATWTTNNKIGTDGGGGVYFQNTQTADLQNQGTTGYGLASFLLGVPFRADGASVSSGFTGAWIHGYYVSDQFNATNKLTVNLGLRYDISFQGYVTDPAKGEPVKAVGDIDFQRGLYILQRDPGLCSERKQAPCIPGTGLPEHVTVSTLKHGGLWHNRYNNLGPRVGLAYRLTKRTVFRASYGRFFDAWTNNSQDQEDLKGTWPSVDALVRSGNRDVPDPAFTFHNPAPKQSLPNPTPFQALSWSKDPYAKTPYSDQWNFGVQQQVSSNTVVSANYVGSHSGNLPMGFIGNVALTPGPGNPQDRAPFPYINPSFYTANWARSHYNSFQFSVDRRFNAGLAALLSYTWSKSMDTGVSGGYFEGQGIQDIYHFNNDRSLSQFDIPHILKASWIYELPFGHGKLQSHSRALDAVMGGWRLNGIATLTSGAPYNIQVSGDSANIGYIGTYLRPNLVGDPHVSNPSPGRWFNTNAFAAPAPYTFGNLGRNALRADWFRDLDLGLFREFAVTEQKRFEFRLEAFNATNSISYGTPVGTFNNINFGRVFGTRSIARQVQLGVKFLY